MNLSYQELEAQVLANNRAADAVEVLAPLLVAALTPFVGKKVRRVDGSLTEALRAALPKVKPNGCEWHVASCASTAGSVWIRLRAYEPIQGKQSVIYSRNGDFVIGQHDRNVLVSVELPKKKPKWTVQEVRSAVDRCNFAREAARDAESQLVHMGVSV